MEVAESSEVQVTATIHRCPLCPFLTESVTDFCRHMCIHTDTVAATTYDRQHQRVVSSTNNDNMDQLPDTSGQLLDDNGKRMDDSEAQAIQVDGSGASTQVLVTSASGEVSEVVTTMQTDGTFCCCVCGATFSNTDQLQTHLRAHTESATSILACSACGLVFTDKDALDQHLLTHNGEATGSLCWVYTTADEKDLMGGSGGADTTTTSVVVLTGNGLTQLADAGTLQLKPSAISSLATSSSSSTINLENLQQQPIQTIASSSTLSQLTSQMTTSTPVVSSVSTTAASTVIASHQQTQQTTSSITTSQPSITLVSSSGSTSDDLADVLNDNEMETMKSGPLACPVCQKVLPDRNDLEDHVRQEHAGAKPFVCNICNKTFCRKEHMGRHMRTHTGERPFSCLTCNKSFSRKVHLESHIRIHTGERPYVCSVCGKSFGRKEHIERHVRIHTGERSFMCGSCGRAFSQKVHLENHARVHTGERPFQCAACGKSFRRREYMKRHMRTHTGERPFQCGTCGKSFRQKSHVDRHTRTHQTQNSSSSSAATTGHSGSKSSSRSLAANAASVDTDSSSNAVANMINQTGSGVTSSNGVTEVIETGQVVTIEEHEEEEDEEEDEDEEMMEDSVGMDSDDSTSPTNHQTTVLQIEPTTGQVVQTGQTMTIQQATSSANDMGNNVLQETQVIHVTQQEMAEIQAAAAAAVNAGLERPKVILQTLPASLGVSGVNTIQTAPQQKVRVVEMVLTCATCGKACLGHLDFQQHLRSHLTGGASASEQQFVAVVEIDQQALESGQIVLTDASGQLTQMQLTGEAVLQDGETILRDVTSSSQGDN